MDLFKDIVFKMHSGNVGKFKIECDALSSNDINTLAKIISDNIKFSEVIGVPRGGIALQNALKKHKSDKGPLLIIDDVLTTGRSMNKYYDLYKYEYEYIIGVVIFARGECPKWVVPVFKMVLQ